MPQEQVETTERKVAVFDENGQTVEEIIETEGGAEGEAAQTDEPDQEQASAAAAVGKYRIGDRTFETQDEALAYAQSQVSALETETQVADAYRQGIRDAYSQTAPVPETVTPAAPAMDTEEFYTNPQAYLDKFAQKIKTETRSELEQREALNQQSNAIWTEFTQRHPALADFRTEVENFTGAHQTEVRAIISTKGRPAAYDWVATKLKSRFEAYASAVKPKRELSNAGGGASPSSRAASVTVSTPQKKALSFSEQIRSIRKRR